MTSLLSLVLSCYAIGMVAAVAPPVTTNAGPPGDCSQSNSGSSFIVAFPKHANDEETNSLVISTSSEQNVEVVVNETKGISFTNVVSNDKRLIFELSDDSRCVHSNRIQNCSVRISAMDGDISVFGYSKYRKSGDNFLAFPVRSLGKDYVIASYVPRSSKRPSEFTVTAVESFTNVTVKFPQMIRNDRRDRDLSEDLQFVLNAGETYQVHSALDLSASRVTSSAPVSVISGADCAKVRAESNCEYMVEQMPPVETLGRSFSVLTHVARPSTGLDVRIIATCDDTHITSDVFNTTIDAFQHHDLVSNDFTALDIETSKPVLVVQYQRGKSSDGRGDPSMSIISPKEQFVKGPIIFPVVSLLGRNDFITITVDIKNASGIQLDGVFVDSTTAHRINTSVSTFWTNTKKLKNGVHTVSHVDPDVPFSVNTYGYANSRGYGTLAATFLRPYRCRDEDDPCPCREGFGGTFCEEKLTSVTCDSDSMTVHLNKELISGNTGDVHFREKSCQSSSSGLNEIILLTNYDQCGTTIEENETTVIFTNVITYDKPEAIPSTDITREYQKQMEVSCCLDKTSQADQSFKPTVGKIKFSDKGSGRFSLRIERLKNESFDNPEDNNAEVWQGQTLYFGVRLSSVEEVGMFIEQCWATAGPGLESTPKHALFTERCPSNEDRTVEVFFPDETDREGFKVDAFAFVGNYDTVYFHCEAKVCRKDKAISNRECFGTRQERKRRSSSFISTQTISSAPIRVRRRSTNDMAANDISTYNPFGMFLVGMIAAVVAIAIMVGVVKLVARPTDMNYKQVPSASMEGI